MEVKSKEAIAAVSEDGRLVDIGEEEKIKKYLSFEMKKVERYTGTALLILWLRQLKDYFPRLS